MALSFEQTNRRKERIDLLRAIIDAVMLPISEGDDKTVFDTLAMAREELKNRPQEYQQLLIDLRNFLDEGGLKDSPRTLLKGAESLMKHINKVLPISMSENDAAVQPAIGPHLVQAGNLSAAKETLHILVESGKTKEEFMEAIGSEPVEPGTTAAAKEVLRILKEGKKANEDFMEAIMKILRMRLSKADQVRFGPCAILEMAFDKWADIRDLDPLKPLLHDLTNLHCDPSYDTQTYELLVCYASLVWKRVGEWQCPVSGGSDIDDVGSDMDDVGSDMDDVGSDMHDVGSDAVDARADLELQHSPNTGAARRLTVSIRGRETGLYLTAHSKAPLTVTLLNGLALSDEGLHLIDDGTGTLSMKKMQDAVIDTCKAKLIAMHEALERAQYPAKRWEPLAECLGCSREEAENAGNHKIADFLTEMLLGLLEKYVGLPPIEDEDSLSECYRLLNALHLDFAVGGATLDACVAFSQDGLKNTWQVLSDQRAGVVPSQLVGEGVSGSELVRAENTERVLKRKASFEAKVATEKEEEGASTNKKLVKERGCHGPYLFGKLTAEEPPTASAPLPCNQGSKVQGVKKIVQCSMEGQLGVPAFHAALEMPMLDKQTHEALKQKYCRQGGVRTFIYIAKGQGTLHIMAGFEDDLYLLNQMEGPKGGSHGHGPLPRWFRLTWGITHVPLELQS